MLQNSHYIDPKEYIFDWLNIAGDLDDFIFAAQYYGETYNKPSEISSECLK